MGGSRAAVISIHAPLAGSDCADELIKHAAAISIHAPLAGSDNCLKAIDNGAFSISIHAPLAGSDRSIGINLPADSYFNPRSPCGERLPFSKVISCSSLFQSTLPLRGATFLDIQPYIQLFISIHAPLAGSDDWCRSVDHNEIYFNPRSPCGERRRGRSPNAACRYFNPRSPCGERQTEPRQLLDPGKFQSTLPLRGATV